MFPYLDFSTAFIILAVLNKQGPYPKRANSMKKEIHPEYFENAKITCACGAIYEIGSTQKAIDVELCSACHPFYTGEQKIIDTARRVEKFKTRAASKSDAKSGKKVKRVKRATQKKAKAEKEA